jgi:asparagine synthase (glutamine-hydrolysing)
LCGISGAFAFARAEHVASDVVERLSESQRHRGPDGEGFWLEPERRLAFAHRRLAIIDIGPDGSQPMWDGEGRFVATYNGEIYNYRELRAELETLGCRFATHSDTEVLLAAVAKWGAAGLRKLRGMFAFALWDNVERELWLARDPLGIKPLYVAERDGVLWFASQARPLARYAPIDTRRDAAGLAGFYLWGHVPEPFTWWKGVRMFPAGHYLRVKEGRSPGAAIPFATAEEAFLEKPEPLSQGELRALLRDSVAHHLVADRPVGVFLSAGIDSTLIAALASEERTRLNTVTLAFDEFQGTASDEAPLAEATARALGCEHTTSRIGAAEFEGLIDGFVAAMDQPTIDGLNSYCVSYATAKTGLKVALSGLGSDELFGGYPSFRDIPKFLRWSRFLRPVGGAHAGRALLALLPRLGLPVKAAGLPAARDLASAYLLRRSLHLAGELDALLDASWLCDGLAELATHEALAATAAPLAAAGLSLHAQISFLETCWYMRNQLLRDTDWASMAHGLEVRVPFVDMTLLRRIAPAVASLRPPGKRELAACSDLFPQGLIDRPKTGFATPVERWVSPQGRAAGGLRNWASKVHHLFAGAPSRQAA